MRKVDLHLTKKGFSSIEVLLAIALFSIVILSMAGALIFSIQSSAETGYQTKATFLAEEGIEAMRAIRNEDYANLTNGNFGLSYASNIWELSGTEDTVDEYTRQIQISDYDPDTKLVESIVSWTSSTGVDRSVSYSTYFTNWQYEVDLGGGGGPPDFVGDWSQPIQVETADLPGNQDGADIWFENDLVYFLRESGNTFAIYDATDPTNLIELGTSTQLTSQGRELVKSGNYVYVVSGANNKEFSVIDVSDPLNPDVIETLNLNKNDDAVALQVQGNYVYVVRDGGNDDFSVIDISDPFNPVEVGTEDILGGTGIVKIGNYAFVSSLDPQNDLQVIDVSNPLAPTGVALANASGNSVCNSIQSYAANRVVLGCSDGALYFFNVSDPLNPVEFATFQTPATQSLNKIEVGNDNSYLWIVGDDDNYELIIVNVYDENNMSLVGTYGDHVGDLKGTYYDQTIDTLFAASTNDTEEVVVFWPFTPAP